MSKTTPSKTAPPKNGRSSTKSKKIKVPDGTITTKPPSRDIPDAEWKLLWARSAGRCQFNGCNRVTYRTPVSNQLAVTAEHAHIIAFSEDGPRGNTPIDADALNRYPNLMLLCHDHHKNIDDLVLRHGYTVETLRKWKEEHEVRVERATAFGPEAETHVITYAASIQNDLPVATEQEVRAALHPAKFPSDQGICALGFGRNGWKDYEGDDFWVSECRNLKKTLQNLKDRLADHQVKNFSVFAIAPQPLLIFLGTQLPELKNVTIFQRHKYPEPTWKWPDTEDSGQAVEICRPAKQDGKPVLVLEFSAPVEDSRVTAVIPDADIWKLRVDAPAYDCIVSRDQLVDFHRQARRVLDEIKSLYGERSPLHVIPVGPVSISTEFGKVRAPKSDSPWILYDQINNKRGFEAVLELDGSEVERC